MLLAIEKLIYGGDGLARLPADERGRGKAVFLPFVLGGEKVEAAVVEEKPGFARARAESIVEASQHRVTPDCPYFGRCGGCHYQHARYEHQLEIKKEILRENLRRIAKLELSTEIQVHASPPWNYRNRTRLQIETQPEFALGYFKLSSHELLPVEQCPISSPLINRAIAALWRTGRAGKAAGVREVEFFANAEDTQLLAEFSCSLDAHPHDVRAWAEALCASMPGITGVVAFRKAKPGAGPGTRNEPVVAVGAAELIYATQQAPYRVSADAFFQTNRHLIEELVNVVAQGQSGGLALDLYAGVGLFSTALACNFHHIVAVESSHPAAADLVYNAPRNVKAVPATVEHYLAERCGLGRPERSASRKSALPKTEFDRERPDLVVVDPPRSGLGERVSGYLVSLGAPGVTYVSCDPATLARDLVSLLAAGYRLEQAHLVDLFPQTYHLETVLRLVR